jgi:hypothetical protein
MATNDLKMFLSDDFLSRREEEKKEKKEQLWTKMIRPSV